MRVLLLDIETAPILAYVWDIWNQNVGLNQIKQDWHILSWSAKWLDKTKIIYFDQRNSKDITNEKEILRPLWKLLDQADILVTQNGIRFDARKINARLIHHGFKPPSSYKHIDTLKIAKKHFAFTSNKLEYMADKLNAKHKKQKNEGFSLWTRCLNGELKAWKELERYNKQDILALEELYYTLYPWDNKINFHLHTGKCHCGSNQIRKKGFALTEKGRYQRFQCGQCGAEHRDGINLLK
jgi:uncharacterized protein YprB with RNaseH-like and TPR domain